MGGDGDGSLCGALAYYWINLAAIWFAAGAALALGAIQAATPTDSIDSERGLPDLSSTTPVWRGAATGLADDSRSKSPRRHA